ncbi:phage-related reverse transcriptase/maturase family protein [Leptospira ryugenii]|uniref:Phage-related reverse transcriptase/maturase family protein n=1 Tax=Leptospira ryugenii TaxID=1917863 RepID=A0A2P2E5C0_9LEPT|nr:antiviral reverse transcriptase Drt3a [Leptospira ryugenii]GBF52073.1 phage-related reverse transcriptase/maturase family protein [Leptospira ryugenii]
MKFDQTFSKVSLSRLINRSDIYHDNRLSNNSVKDQVLALAQKRAKEGFETTPVGLNVTTKNKKKIYQLEDISDELVLRKINENIKYFSNFKLIDRDSIIFTLLSLLKETHPYTVIRLDIKSFYESVNTDSILLKVNKNLFLSRQNYQLLKSFFSFLKREQITGLARGLPLSATLAEFELNEYDKTISNLQGIYFYQRFVDDIILIVDPVSDISKLQQKLKDDLPTGLSFNTTKTKIITVDQTGNKGSTDIIETLDYLGYHFKLHTLLEDYQHKQKSLRRIEIDISEGKKNKFKSRLIKSLLDYHRNQDLRLLTDRVKFITGNFSLLDRRNGIKRKSGIYYNYKYINYTESEVLPNLDNFFRNILLVPKGKIYSKISTILSQQERRNLLKLSFRNGFKDKVFHYFSPSRLSKIKRCWEYV